MKVLMTGGGTAGHINPALAIAETIKRNNPDAEIAFVGTPKGMENKLVAAAGYPMYHVMIQGIRRSLSPANLLTAYYILTAPHKAKKIIDEFKPDIVVGTGGYVCWPILLAASRCGIPTAIHEANAVPGVATKQLEAHVDTLFVDFEETRNYLKYKDKVMHVGNPLRADFGTMGREEARAKWGVDDKYKYIILSCGGSLGALMINNNVLGFMDMYVKHHPEILHIHSAGTRYYKELRAQFENLGLDKYENLILSDYIYDMPLKMSAADLVINRAGAMTLSELCLMKKNCILIPSPNVTNNHQYKNAKVLSDAGGAILIEEKDLTAEKLTAEISALISDNARRAAMSDAIAKLAVPDANKLIYEEIIRLVGTKK